MITTYKSIHIHIQISIPRWCGGTESGVDDLSLPFRFPCRNEDFLYLIKKFCLLIKLFIYWKKTNNEKYKLNNFANEFAKKKRHQINTPPKAKQQEGHRVANNNHFPNWIKFHSYQAFMPQILDYTSGSIRGWWWLCVVSQYGIDSIFHIFSDHLSMVFLTFPTIFCRWFLNMSSDLLAMFFL